MRIVDQTMLTFDNPRVLKAKPGEVLVIRARWNATELVSKAWDPQAVGWWTTLNADDLKCFVVLSIIASNILPGHQDGWTDYVTDRGELHVIMFKER